MKIPLQVMNTYKYKRFVPSCSFLFLCICFSTATQSCVKAQRIHTTTLPLPLSLTPVMNCVYPNDSTTSRVILQ